MRSALTALFLVACSQPAPAPTKPVGGGTGSGLSPDRVPSDAAPATQEETLAAIQKAMNELDEGSQGCWAVAATDRYDVSGDLVMRIDIGPTKATAAVVTDNTHDPKLVACMTQVLGAYNWAPPLYGQTIQLPFSFKKVLGQSVIDRRFVDAHAQGKVAVSVLLDELNTGNSAASMIEVALANGGSVAQNTDRAQLVYALANTTLVFTTEHKPGTVVVGGATSWPLKAGDMVYIPATASYELRADAGDARVVIVFVPGGREGTARAGALPTNPTVPKTTPRPVWLQAKDAKTFGPATIYLDSAENGKGAPLAASILQMPAGAKVPEHVHANETEMLYILEGAGTMTIAGQDIAVTPTSVIQIPANTKHAVVASAALKAVQIYTPGGPEQRFKKKP